MHLDPRPTPYATDVCAGQQTPSLVKTEFMSFETDRDPQGMSQGDNRTHQRDLKPHKIRHLSAIQSWPPGSSKTRRRYTLLKLLDTRDKLGQFALVRFVTITVGEQADEWRVGEWSLDSRCARSPVCLPPMTA